MPNGDCEGVPSSPSLWLALLELVDVTLPAAIIEMPLCLITEVLELDDTVARASS